MNKLNNKKIIKNRLKIPKRPFIGNFFINGRYFT